MARIAFRDLWAGRRHIVLAVLSLAIGVGAMTAARALAFELSRRLNGDMRNWIAADAVVTLRQALTEEQRAEIGKAARRGFAETESLETYSLASSDEAADPAVVSVRCVDPRYYPWYGTVGLEPAGPLSAALAPDAAAVSRPLAERLAVSPGGRFLLNGVPFRVAAILTAEPDRFASAPNPYPRVLLSEAAFARSGIAVRGNAILWRLLFRVPPAADIAQFKAQLRGVFPDGQIVGYRDHSDARVAVAFDAALTHLDLAAWAALALGALGMAVVIYLHLRQRLDTVAILKMVGARWRQILSVYLLEVGAVSLAGSALGAALGLPLARLGPLLARNLLPFPLAVPWRWTLAAEAAGFGVLCSLAAAAVPLVAVRTTAPFLLLRRDVERRANPAARLAAIVPALAMAALAPWLLHSARAGAAFLLGLAACGLVLWGVGHVVLRAVGPRNLSRPGHHGASRFAALSLGVMLVTASWLGPAAVGRAIQESLPLPGADLFLFGLGPGQTDALRQFLASDADVTRPAEVLPVVILRLSKVRGFAPASTIPERWAATCSSARPAIALTAGRWWRPDASPPEVVLAESAARTLGVRPGQSLEFYSNDRTVAARVTGVRRLDAVDELLGGVLFPCTAFDGLSVSYEAGVATRSGRAEAVRRRVAARFPSVPVVSRQELAAVVQSVSNDALWMLRAVALLILAEGTMVLVLIGLAQERTRAREIAILKSLGARPGQLRRALAAEWFWLGALAGAAGGLAGAGFAALLLSIAFRKPVAAWDTGVFAGVIVLSVLAALAAGWASSAALLRRKPLAILREEWS